MAPYTQAELEALTIKKGLHPICEQLGIQAYKSLKKSELVAKILTSTGTPAATTPAKVGTKWTQEQLAGMKNAELHVLCEQLGIQSYKSLKKSELVAKILTPGCCRRDWRARPRPNCTCCVTTWACIRSRASVRRS